MDKLRKVPNSIFTFENNTGNSHKKRIATF